MKPLAILNDHEYFAEITQKIATTKPGDRVAMMVMSFDPTEPITADLMRELTAAAARDVHVQLNVDANSFMVGKGHPLKGSFARFEPTQIRGALFHTKYAALEKLRQNNGQFHITNLPERRPTNPYGGRSHIKFTVINGEAYIGGCNLDHTWQLDLMVRTNDRPTVDWMYDFMLESGRSDTVADVLSGKDIERRLDNVTSLLVDAGIKNQSLIYDEALKLIDEAREWLVITCQFFPGKRTAEHLLAAQKRGVRVTIYFGNLLHQGGMILPHGLAELAEHFQNPRSFFATRVPRNVPRLHAKLLASEQAAMIGSHNYVVQGVKFGTAEATLLRRDPAFARQAVEAFESRLQEAKA